MGPLKFSGTASPRRTRRSWPLPMFCRACPTLPPPTMMAGTTLVAGVATTADTWNLKAVVVGKMGKERVAMAIEE